MKATKMGQNNPSPQSGGDQRDLPLGGTQPKPKIRDLPLGGTQQKVTAKSKPKALRLAVIPAGVIPQAAPPASAGVTPQTIMLPAGVIPQALLFAAGVIPLLVRG